MNAYVSNFSDRITGITGDPDKVHAMAKSFGIYWKKVDTGDGNKLALVKEGVTLRELVDGLNALGVGPRDLISILQAIKTAGALQADIELM